MRRRTRADRDRRRCRRPPGHPHRDRSRHGRPDCDDVVRAESRDALGPGDVTTDDEGGLAQSDDHPLDRGQDAAATGTGAQRVTRCRRVGLPGSTRMRRWRALAVTAHPSASRDGRTPEVRFEPGAGLHTELVALAAAEQDCSSFVTWTIAQADDHPVLRVRAMSGSSPVSTKRSCLKDADAGGGG